MKNTSCLMTIFGATGDLTHRKLIPALYQLFLQGYLDNNFAVLAIGRRAKTTEDYRAELRESVAHFSTRKMNDEVWDKLAQKIEYLQVDFQNFEDYEILARHIEEKRANNQYPANDLYYLAVAPDHFGTIVSNLRQHSLADAAIGKNVEAPWQRLVIEKPFGKDLESALQLNQKITEVFPESSVYRIDHYLAKEMIQNITMLRRQNAIFEPLWNNQYIDNVQISVLESEGVGSRGGYYDKTGALKDMIQNHLLQVVSIIAMDLPEGQGAEAVRDEKVRLLKSITGYESTAEGVPVVLGQYSSYRSEDRVASDSNTETFIALKLSLDNPRWKGVPFYLVTGKKMASKSALVTIEFKKPPQADPSVSANLLQVGIQPREGIHLKLNTKKPTVIDEMDVAEMEYCQSCQYNFNTPDSYEKLLLDVMLGDSTRFTRWDELELSWQLTDEIAGYCQSHDVCEIYPDNSCGPLAASRLIEEDGRRWWHLSEDGGAPEPYTCKTADSKSTAASEASNNSEASGEDRHDCTGDCNCTGRH